VLSIDSLGQRSLDPAGIAARPELWPERVIVMTLDRVGAMAGPDTDAIGAIRQRGSAHRLYAAGGVRRLADLEALQREGVAGALVASALHSGDLPGDHIRAIGMV
jgi:phosphoribosylformimino-5-aminoimidazole carboxamide ribotide isomerase